ncbi:MAG: carbohydrate ABC transporter permease [Gemmatimonadetes bacterium]|jgi:multiple sugar transport system permease protein|nr:carbohydrate ABC transporter permease [Gemmatimonadota bacterium]MBT6143817.1 carbohydrate ABC transporter permease [Gemmatimonadota bacterium]MBT7862437.1 carbohydrate ABC transporter permease [Gemmatimonadota bacterium]
MLTVFKDRGVLVRFIVLGLLGFVLAMPFVWMIGASVKSRAEIEAGGIHIVAEDFNPQNYPILFGQLPEPMTGEKLELKFGRWFFNSFFVAFTTTLIQVMTSALAAFAFSRLRWRGRDAVFLLYLGTMMIPGLTLMIPNFQVMVWLGFLNTYHGLIIPASFTAFGTFLLRQFMLGIPTALDEAAHIDGASNWQIFVDVILPLARPGIIALAMITFLFQYQQFFWPLIMLNDQQFFPLPVGLLELDSTFGQQTELIMAAATITVAPLIVLFVVCQKFLVRGIQLGGVKG